jgi:hypothetical protein
MLRRPKLSKNEVVAPKEEDEGIERNMILKFNIQEREWGRGVEGIVLGQDRDKLRVVVITVTNIRFR